MISLEILWNRQNLEKQVINQIIDFKKFLLENGKLDFEIM